MVVVCYFCGCVRKILSVLADHMRSKHTQEQPIKCPQCLKTFASISTLHHHKASHIRSERVKCLQCPKSFITKGLLNRHVINVHGLDKYECDKCNFKTVTRLNLQRHSQIHEKNRPRRVICEICRKGFFTSHHLKLHLRIHSKNRRRIQCYFCPNTYTQISSLYPHLAFHTKEVLVGGAGKKCRKCSEVYDNRKELEKHVRVVHGVARPFKCDLCGVKRDKNSSLKRHMASKHSSLRPFQCSLCPSAFKFSEILKSHVQNVHFRVREYGCDKCPKMFARLGGLEMHLQSIHSEVKPFPCTICGAGFGSKSSLKSHLQEKHELKGYQCYFCTREFTRYSSYRDHNYTHTKERWFNCQLNVEDKKGKIRACDFDSFRKQALKDHIRGKHEGYLLPCTLCSYKTTRKHSLFAHITRMHTREKTIKCVNCEKLFYTPKEFKVHQCRPIDNLLKTSQKNVFPCLICRSTRVTFRTEQSLKIHMEKYHPDKSFRCYFCSKVFNQEGVFQGHVRVEHTMEKVHKCDICWVDFFTGRSLRRHRQTHKQPTKASIKHDN